MNSIRKMIPFPATFALFAFLPAIAYGQVYSSCEIAPCDHYNPGAIGHREDTKAAPVMEYQTGDDEFVRHAAAVENSQREASKIALQKATDAEMQRFAQAEFEESNAALNYLRQTADRYQITPQEFVGTPQKRSLDKLAALSGDHFNSTYLRDERKDTQAALAYYTYEMDEGSDPGLKVFAANMLPILERKLQLVRHLEQTLHAQRS